MVGTLLAFLSTIATARAAYTDTRFPTLIHWLEDRGAYLGPIELRRSGIGAGSGAFVTQDVDENEVLFTVPTSACVSLYDACGDREVGETFARLASKGQGGATVALAGFIAKEWLCEGAEGKMWGPYLQMLPWDAEWPPEEEQEQEHVLWWSEKQVDSLYGSEAYGDAVAIRDEVALACKVVKGLVGKSVRASYRSRGDPIWKWIGSSADEDIDKATRGAFVSILTRAFGQEDSEDEENRLVPLLDMLQHDSEPNVRHKTEVSESSGDERVVVRARRPLVAGEELLNFYGDLPPSKFLSRFGFVPGRSVGEFISSIQQ